MPSRKRGNKLAEWEISLIKTMLARGTFNDQDILAYFTRPTRTINHRCISEIRTGQKHKAIKPVSGEQLDEFLVAWPNLDPESGLSIRGDELLIKAREAMIAAVHTFNSAGLYFRAELFIVTAVIAWTYLLHAYFKREGIDYRYKKSQNGPTMVETTKGGAEKYWELGQCIRSNKSPLDKGCKNNIEFLLELRHEIEHRSTSRIDDALGAKLQACCLNFNKYIKKLFGPQYGLERRLPIALQFVTFSSDQRSLLKKAQDLPRHIQTAISEFNSKLSTDEQNDPSFAYRVAMIHKTANHATTADEAILIIDPESPEAKEINRVLLKEVEKKKYLPSEIVQIMISEGYRGFNLSRHAEFWKAQNAKLPAKHFGVQIAKTWYWYESWLEEVRKHCLQNKDKYNFIAPQNVRGCIYL